MSAAPRRPADPARGRGTTGPKGAGTAKDSTKSARGTSPAKGAKPAKGSKPSNGAEPAKGTKAATGTKPSKDATQSSGRPPRQPSKPRQASGAARAGWLSGIRFSGFSVVMMGVIVLAVVVLAPTIAAFAEQRQRIADLRAEVSAQEAGVLELREQRERWDDETYVITQARERLYYVLPGEISYLVIDDRSEAAKAASATDVSAEVTETKGDWMRTLLASVMTAGLTPAAEGAGR
ncbi:septum formation initiator family protein [Agromyces sp. LHK192]|uniref:septum formation initiator family protein n=1 Tax=Agromyces sp. LHK192 TaxID=2498704 RepID=UPI000FDCBD7B|nr:septum formation initiator family protein [Agromyces sp. LHK192]